MSDNNVSAHTSSTQKRKGRKAGRTLLVKPESESFDSSVFASLEGLTNQHHTDKSNAHFLTFDTVGNAVNAYRHFRKEHSDDVRVKFAHYRVFFTLQGLTEEHDYSDVKTAHMNFVRDNTSGRVLYYKLYRKNDSYIGCGEMTLDTKESFDKLVGGESEHKNFTVVEGVTGVHYRYNRTQQQSNTTTA